MFEIVIIIALTLLNGVFAMWELAVVSSRKARLRGMADQGVRGAVRHAYWLLSSRNSTYPEAQTS